MAVCLFRSVVVMLFCMILSFAWNNADKYDHSIDDRKERLLTQLFPNRTNPYNTKERHALRKLPITKTPVSEDYVACIVCKEADMDACSILTGLLIQEVYYPHDLGFSESCKVVESLGARMESEIFGVGRTFRDTPQCREIVMQYLCLFFGSNNGMYKNYCVFHEDYTGDKTHWLLAPRPPCKSFCVQVAMVCANDMDFIQTCNEIECPQDDGACTADPIINNSPLDAKLGCDVPYYKDPYAPKSAAAAPLRPGSTVAGLASLVLYGVVLLSSAMYLGFV